jgi:hypothetical protein
LLPVHDTARAAAAEKVRAMTDWPRFEPVKGPADTAYRQYNGGRQVTMVFRLIDWWRSGAGAAPVRAAPALDPASGATEVHERPARRILVMENPAPSALVQPHARVVGLIPDERFSYGFLIGSARTRRSQATLLAVLATVTTVLVVLEADWVGLSSRQTAQRSGRTSMGVLPRALDRGQAANAMWSLAAGGCDKSAAWPPSCSEVRP